MEFDPSLDMASTRGLCGAGESLVRSHHGGAPGPGKGRLQAFAGRLIDDHSHLAGPAQARRHGVCSELLAPDQLHVDADRNYALLQGTILI